MIFGGGNPRSGPPSPPATPAAAKPRPMARPADLRLRFPAGTPEEALDCACGLYLNDPSAWVRPTYPEASRTRVP